MSDTIVRDIVDAALCMSRVSFWLFVVSVLAHWAKMFLVKTPDAPSELIKKLREDDPKPSLEQIIKLLKEVSNLANALVKGGPAIWSLTGSIFFLLIAAVVGGVLPAM